MKYALAAFAAALLSAGAAGAQTTSPSTTSPSASPSMQLSASECTSLWQQANPSNAKGLSESQAKPYVTDFKAANANGDSTIDQSEFMAACNKGLVKSSSSSGASSGTSGSSSSDKAPPAKSTDELAPDSKSPNKY